MQHPVTYKKVEAKKSIQMQIKRSEALNTSAKVPFRWLLLGFTEE